jgi:hypothetical protein
VAGDIENPRIWVNADVYVADVGADEPNDVTAEWPSAWAPLGLLSEDGMTEANEQELTDHYAYGGILVRTTKSKQKRTIQVAALEDNPTVWSLVNPGSEATSGGGVTTREVKIRNAPDPRAFGLELRDGDITSRIVIPRGEVTEVGDRSIVDNQMAMFELTITVYPDAEGVLYYEITDDPQAEVVGGS